DTGFILGDGFNGTVAALAVQSDGQIVAGGSFSTYNLLPTNYIIRLNTDGTKDITFTIGDGFNGSVSTLAIQSDDKIVVGGSFTSYSGVAANYITRLNTDGTKDITFTIGDGFNNSISALAVQSGDKIVIGGSFTSYNGTSANKITRLNTDGTQDTGFIIGNGFNNTVNALAVQSGDKIVVGGVFSTYNGVTANYIIRLNADGTQDTGFNIGDGFNGTVAALAVQSDGKVIVGGSFTSYNGAAANYIIRLNTDGSKDTNFNIGDGFDSSVTALAIQSDGKIIVGGNFITYNMDSAHYITRLNTNGSKDTDFTIGMGFNMGVSALALQSDGKIIVGGNFSTYNMISANKIIRLNTDGSNDTDFAMGMGFNMGVSALAIQSNGKIIVGGRFSSYNMSSANDIIRLNTNGSQDTGFNIGVGFNMGVNTLAVQSNGKIVVGGNFSTYNGLPANKIIRLNTDGTRDAFFSIGNGFSMNVNTLVVQSGGKIIVGGNFTMYDMSPVNYITRLNADGTRDTDFDIGNGFDSNVYALAVQNDEKTLVGGNFSSYNGAPAGYLVSLYEDKTAPTGTVSYNPATATSGNVIATLSGSEAITITNNGGLSGHTFTGNGSFIFEFEDAVGNTGSTTATVTWIDKTAPTGTISYNPATATSGNVIATLSGSEAIIITNNGGLSGHTFTGNGSFIFEFQDLAGNTGNATATVTGIDKVFPVITIDPYNTSPTNQDVIVTASTNEGTLNTTTHTFTGNGSFDFIATDAVGNATTQTVTISNIDKTAPVLTRYGPFIVTLEVGSPYTEFGAIATDNMDVDINDRVVISGNVDIHHVGTYIITYDVTDAVGNAATQRTRTVHVVDTTKPVITLNGSAAVTVEYGNRYTEQGATRTDNYDGDGTATISGSVNTGVLGTYILNYIYVDTSGNTGNILTRTVNVVDTTAPNITAVTLTPDSVGTTAQITITQTVTDVHGVTDASVSIVGTGGFVTGVTLSLVSGNTQNGVRSGTYTFPNGAFDGIYLISGSAIDSSTNTGYREIGQIILDRTAPTLSLTSITPTYVGVANLVTVSILAQDTTLGITGITVRDITSDTSATLNSGTAFPTSSGQMGSWTFTQSVTGIQGIHTEEIVVNDLVYNSRTATGTFIYDTIKPTASLTYSPTSGTATSGDVIATLSGSEPITITNTDGLTHTFTDTGTFTFEFIDLAGNTGEATATVTWIDKIAPVITIDSYNTSPTNQDVIVTASTNEGTLNTTTHTFTGNGSFDFVATDAVGNETTQTVTISNIDKILPSGTITYSPTSGALTSGDVIATLSGSEEIIITTNGGISGHTFTGNDTFLFEFTDLAGNTGETTATVTWIDKTNPSGTILYDPVTITNGNVIATLSGSEPITITNNDGSSGYTFTGNGTFIFTFEDAVGNIGSTTATVNWIVPANSTAIDTSTITGTFVTSGNIFLVGYMSTGIVFTSTGTLAIQNTGNTNNVLQIDLSGFTIMTSGGTWNGVLFPPSVIGSLTTGYANFGETGLPAQRVNNGSTTTTTVLFQTIQAGSNTDSLIALGGYFTVSFVVAGGTSGDVLEIYRSEDGSRWTANAPDTTCALHSNLVCSFRTDHLSFFVTAKKTTTTNPVGNNGGGGGGGGSFAKDICPLDRDCSDSYYDTICGKCSLIEKLVQKLPFHAAAADKPAPSIVDSSFSTELNNAYLRAYGYDITTITTIQKANLKSVLVRKDMAKMISNFALNVLNKNVSTGATCIFSDTSSLSKETQYYAMVACRLGLMGYESDGVTLKKTFDPNQKVDRAQFGTILSRLLRGTKNNGGIKYYENHLKALKAEGIMTKIDTPSAKELRGRVMLMMQRVAETK
ncbi:MAG: immunoglobulin-like domain-containing protein, partial [Candidatus Absconditabacterales bacterium]